MFRTGAERWSTGRRALKVLQFGMVHALIGIPIGAAMALSIGGAYFMSRVPARVPAHRLGDRSDARVDHGAHRVQRSDHRDGAARHRAVPAVRAAVHERSDPMNAEPVDIDIVRDRSVTITFDDGVVCEFPVDALARRVPVRHMPRAARTGRGRLAATRAARHHHHRRRPAQRGLGPVDRLERRAQHGHLRMERAAPMVAGGARPGARDRPRCRVTARPTTTLGSLPSHGTPPAADAAEPGVVDAHHAALLPPPRPRGRPQLHPLRQGGVQRVSRAGSGRFALPRLREGRSARRRHPGEVLERQPADARHLRAHRHQRRRLHVGRARRPEHAHRPRQHLAGAVRPGAERPHPAVRRQRVVPTGHLGVPALRHHPHRVQHADAVPVGPAHRTAARSC